MRVQTQLIHATMVFALSFSNEAIAQVKESKLPCNEFCQHWMGYDKVTTNESRSLLHDESTSDRARYSADHRIKKVTKSPFASAKDHLQLNNGEKRHFRRADAVSVSRAPDARAEKPKLSRAAVFPTNAPLLSSQASMPQAAIRAESKKSASLSLVGPDLIAVPRTDGRLPKATSSGPLPAPSDNVEHSTANLPPRDQSRHSDFAQQPLVVNQSPSVEDGEENTGGSRLTRQRIQEERADMTIQAIKALKLMDQEGL